MPKEVVKIEDALKRLGNLLMDESTEALESKIRLQYASDPNFFCEDFLGVHLWEKQKEILESVRDNERTTVRSCNSAGKTFTAACAVLWFLKSFIPSTVVTTAPTARQVRDILWKEVASRYHLSKKQIGGKLLQQSLTMSNQKKWFATGFTTSKEDLEKFQGFHNDNILIIVDEASGVDRMIFEAIEGLMASGFARLLLIGNPTDEATVFGDSFKPASGYSKMAISAFDTPNLKSGKLLFPQLVTLDWVESRKTDWGEDSPLYQVHALGQFPLLSEDTLISLSWIEAAVDKEVDVLGDRVVGMDVARYGQDETVMVYRIGNKMESMQIWSGQDSMYSTGRLISVLGDTGAFANVDEIGLGAGVVDRAKEQNFSVRGINIGGRSSKPDKFFNLRAEVYWNLRELFQNGTISIKKDLLLMDELSKMKYEFTSKGQIKIESKEDIKKRLRRSPDRADAFALAFMNPVSTTSSMGDVLEIFDGEKYYNSNSDALKCPICLSNNITSLSDDLHMCLKCGILFDNNKEVVGKKQLLSEVISEDIMRRKEYERNIDIKILPRQFA